MKMTIGYKIEMFGSDGKPHDMQVLVPEYALEDILEKVVQPSLEDGESFEITKIAYSEVLDN